MSKFTLHDLGNLITHFKNKSWPFLFRASYEYFKNKKITFAYFSISLLLSVIGIIWLQINYFNTEPRIYIGLNHYSNNTYKIKSALVIIDLRDDSHKNKQTMSTIITIEANPGSTLSGEELQIEIPKELIVFEHGEDWQTEFLETNNANGHYLNYKIKDNVNSIGIVANAEGDIFGKRKSEINLDFTLFQSAVKDDFPVKIIITGLNGYVIEHSYPDPVETYPTALVYTIPSISENVTNAQLVLGGINPKEIDRFQFVLFMLGLILGIFLSVIITISLNFVDFLDDSLAQTKSK